MPYYKGKSKHYHTKFPDGIKNDIPIEILKDNFGELELRISQNGKNVLVEKERICLKGPAIDEVVKALMLSGYWCIPDLSHTKNKDPKKGKQ